MPYLDRLDAIELQGLLGYPVLILGLAPTR
jgi:hypothetical protein